VIRYHLEITKKKNNGETDVVTTVEETALQEEPIKKSPRAEISHSMWVNEKGEIWPWIMQLMTLLAALSGIGATWYGILRKKREREN